MEMSQDEIKEAIEHRDVLLALRGIIATDQGKTVFKYLFKHFEVGQVPQPGLPHDLLLEFLGMYRAGQSLFKLASEADPGVAGALLALIEKDRYAKLVEQSQNEPS